MPNSTTEAHPPLGRAQPSLGSHIEATFGQGRLYAGDGDIRPKLISIILGDGLTQLGETHRRQVGVLVRIGLGGCPYSPDQTTRLNLPEGAEYH